MPTLDYLQELFRYNHWSNCEALNSVTAAADKPQRAVQILAHIAGAELLWFERLLESPQTAIVWPDLALPEIQIAFDDMHQRWVSYLSEDRLDEKVDYVNSKGEPWSNSRRDILMHVVIHGSYHRGQVATLLGLAKQDSAYTDFIHGVRQQLF